MSSATGAALERARTALERESRRLDALSKASDSESLRFDHDGFEAIGRALSFVVMGGVLEDLMRELSGAIASDLVAMRIERRTLPITLLAAMEATAFRQCFTDNVGALVARADVVQAVLLHPQDPRMVPDLSDVLNLADGTTVGEKNFAAIWAILGLSGSWQNHPNDRLLLREIKEKRNDVAHWKEDPAEIGRKKRTSDLVAMISRLISLIDHLDIHIGYWLEDQESRKLAAAPAAPGTTQ